MGWILKMIFYSFVGLVFVFAAMVYLGSGQPSQSNSQSTLNPEWPGADFPSSAWQTSQMEWYVQWKRVRKYARIAFETAQPIGFPALNRQSRDLYLHAWTWSESRQKSACFKAAEQLNDGLNALSAGDAKGFGLVQSSEVDGDRCLAAIQKATYGH